jgi:coenzyme PQQ precursor peptide PqqA
MRAGKLERRPLGTSREEREMSWTAPKIVEVALGGEINCYACARVK